VAVGADEHLLVCNDMNGHAGERVDGFERIHGGHGYGVRNTEGETLLSLLMRWIWSLPIHGSRRLISSS